MSEKHKKILMEFGEIPEKKFREIQRQILKNSECYLRIKKKVQKENLELRKKQRCLKTEKKFQKKYSNCLENTSKNFSFFRKTGIVLGSLLFRKKPVKMF